MLWSIPDGRILLITPDGRTVNNTPKSYSTKTICARSGNAYKNSKSGGPDPRRGHQWRNNRVDRVDNVQGPPSARGPRVPDQKIYLWRIKAEFTDKRQRRTKKFHDELSSDCRLTDPMLAFKVDVFYRLVDVAINQLELRFEGQRQVAQLFKFIFPDTMLHLSDAELETEARNLQTA